jgi:hypothetical protein
MQAMIAKDHHVLLLFVWVKTRRLVSEGSHVLHNKRKIVKKKTSDKQKVLSITTITFTNHTSGIVCVPLITSNRLQMKTLLDILIFETIFLWVLINNSCFKFMSFYILCDNSSQSNLLHQNMRLLVPGTIYFSILSLAR